MTKPQSSLKPLVGSLGCLSVAAATTLMSGTISGGALSVAGKLLNGILGDLSINIASDQLLKLSPKMLRKSLLPRSKDTSNHDLQKSLQEALKTALVNCLEIYVKALGDQADKDHINALEGKIAMVCEAINEKFLEEIGSTISDTEIIDFEEGIDLRVNELLTQFLFDIEDFEQHGKVFTPLLQEQLPLQITYAFTEELKENPRCWIAYQRSLLQELRAESKIVIENQNAANQKLDQVINQLDVLHQAGHQVDDNLLKSLIQSNAEINGLLKSSKSLLEDFMSEQRRRMDQLEQKMMEQFHALMDISLTNQALLKEIRACVLPTIRQETTHVKSENANDLERLLREVLPKYLQYMTEEYRLISLPNVQGSASKQTIPLDNIYIALQLANDRTSKDFHVASQFIKKQVTKAELNAQRDLTAYEKRQIEADILEQNQTLRNFDYQDLKDTSDQSISLAQLFGKERYAVLLGDPGSGKSTIVKWLALQMANQFDPKGEQRVRVNASQIYGEKTEDVDQEIDLGPSRLPIVIKIPEYTQFFEKQKHSQEKGIIDFCGIHIPTIPDVTPEDFRKLISHFLASNQAVVFLDGMDEVVKDREKVLLKIRKFITYWINLGQNQVNLLSPQVAGGNQILVTSRIVGYHAAPLDDFITEVYVRAMDNMAIKSFCQLWTKETAENQDQEEIQKDTEGLIEAIFDEQKPRIRELATNPLLITILALLYHNKGKKLPRNRTELYEQTVNTLMSKWSSLHEDIHPEQVKHLIEEVASVIHSSPSEVIKESDLKELLVSELGVLNKESNHSQNQHLAEAMIRIVRQDVGLLSERGHDLYHFLHRTFQEFLSARKLIRNPETAVDQLLNKINDPVWREPVTMAIAYSNATWSESRFHKFVDQLLNTNEGYASLIPLGPMLVSSTFPDLKNVNQALVMQLLQRLLLALDNEVGLAGFEKVSEKIIKSIDQLRENEHGDLFYICCKKIFSQPEYGKTQWTLLNLACDGGWYQESWLEDIYQHLDIDPSDFDFPIDRYLQLLFSTGSQVDDQSLLRLKSRLISNPELVERIKEDPLMLRLISVLYGGWPTHPKIKLYDELHVISNAFHAETIEMEETGFSYAVRLDTELGLVKGIKSMPITFNVQHIHRDSYFTRKILLCLQSKEQAFTLVNDFVDVFKNSRNEEERALALLGLAALNLNIHALVSEDPSSYLSIYNRFKSHLQRLHRVMYLPLAEFIRRSDQNAYLRKQSWSDFEMRNSRVALYGLMELCAARNIRPPLLVPGDPGRYIYEAEKSTDSVTAPVLFTARFADALLCLSMPIIGDQPYKLAVHLDVMGKHYRRNQAIHLLEAVLHIPYSPLINSSLNSSWEIPQVIIPAQTKRDNLVNYMMIVHGLNKDAIALKEFLIHAIWKHLDEYPALKRLALCLFLEQRGTLSTNWFMEIFERIGYPEELLFKTVSEQDDPYIQFLMAYFIERAVPTVQMPLIMSNCLPKITGEHAQLVAISCAQSIDLQSKLYHFHGMLQDQMSELNVAMKTGSSFDQLNQVLGDLSKSEDPIITCYALLLKIHAGGEEDKLSMTEHLAKAIPWVNSDIVKSYLIKKYENLEEAAKVRTNYFPAWEKSFNDDFYFYSAVNASYVSLYELTQKYPKQEYLQILAISQMTENYSRESFELRDLDLLKSKLCKEELSNKEFKNLLLLGRDGLQIDQNIVGYIDRLDVKAEAEKLSILLPLLELNSEKDLSLIEHWKHHENRQIQNLYRLLLGENRVLNIDVLDSMIDILINDADRLSRRAQIVLHGPHPVFGFAEPAFRTSELGYDYLVKHYKKRYDYQFDQPFVFGVLGWSHENWVDDDPEILIRAVETHAHSSGKSQKAHSYLLRNSNRLTSETLEVLCQLIKEVPPSTGKVLWFTLAHVIKRIHRSLGFLDFSIKDLEDIMKSEKARRSLREAEKLCEDITQIWDLTKALEEFQPTQEDLNTQCQQIKKGVLIHANLNLEASFENAEELWDKLIKVSDLSYYYKSEYEKTSKQFLSKHSDDEDKLRLLIKLVLKTLDEELFNPVYCNLGSNAIFLLADWAKERPEFVNHHFPKGNKTKRLMAEIIVQHPSYIARSCMVKLVGALNFMTKEILQSLIHAVTDLDVVREAAIKVLIKFSDHFEDDNLTVLQEILDGNSAETKSSIIKMFANISMNPTTSYQMRHKTLDILARQLQEQRIKPSKNQFIYHYNDFTDHNKSIPFAQWKESLNEVIFSELIRFTE